MKNLTLLILVFFALSGLSCFRRNEDPQRAKMVGHWRLTQLEADRETVDLRPRDMVYVLQGDGSFILQVQGKETSSGRWNKRGKVVTFQHGGGKAEAGALTELSAERFTLLSEKDQLKLTFTRIY